MIATSVAVWYSSVSNLYKVQLNLLEQSNIVLLIKVTKSMASQDVTSGTRQFQSPNMPPMFIWKCCYLSYLVKPWLCSTLFLSVDTKIYHKKNYFSLHTNIVHNWSKGTYSNSIFICKAIFYNPFLPKCIWDIDFGHILYSWKNLRSISAKWYDDMPLPNEYVFQVPNVSSKTIFPAP